MAKKLLKKIDNDNWIMVDPEKPLELHIILAFVVIILFIILTKLNRFEELKDLKILEDIRNAIRWQLEIK